MKTASASVHTRFPGEKFPFIAALLALVLFCQPTFILVADGQGRTQLIQRGAKKTATMTADQRVAHVLSRLTFGARPGDFERVKAMGVDAFISQQLDPDSFLQLVRQRRHRIGPRTFRSDLTLRRLHRQRRRLTSQS